MGKYIVEVKPHAQKQIKFHIKSGNQAVIRKIKKILIELSENPYEGEGKPEELKYELLGFWSRRINLEHRLIYQIDEDKVYVTVISALGHYEL